MGCVDEGSKTVWRLWVDVHRGSTRVGCGDGRYVLGYVVIGVGGKGRDWMGGSCGELKGGEGAGKEGEDGFGVEMAEMGLDECKCIITKPNVGAWTHVFLYKT